MANVEYGANFAPLTPVSFLRRAARFFGDRPAVVYGKKRFNYSQYYDRVARLSGALVNAGIGAGDCVAVMAPNIPQMLEAHYAIPTIGAIINPLNVTFDASAIGYSLRHARARAVIFDRQYLETIQEALRAEELDLLLIAIHDDACKFDQAEGAVDYEDFLADVDTTRVNFNVTDESQRLSLIYTSGTTAQPKAVTYSHRGCYLAAISNALSFGLDHNSCYLWTWPMFHTHGLSFVWGVTAVAGTHICLREYDAAAVFEHIGRHRVSHFCVPPTLMNSLANDPSAKSLVRNEVRQMASSVRCIVGGAAPASTSIAKLEACGIEVVHQYGCTECYGPITVRWPRPGWESMAADERYSTMARQGTPVPAFDDMMVADIDTLQPVPRDGTTIGEIVVRGNTVFQGYFGDEEATQAALSDGWFRTGDIATWYRDGTLEIKDRTSDLISTGGRRISSVEIDEVLYQHPDVLEAAAIASPHDEEGQVPGAFITLRAGSKLTSQDLTTFCRERLAEHEIPRWFEFGELPRTATGKIKKSELRRLAKRG